MTENKQTEHSQDSQSKEKSALETAGEELFNYAIDREDIKWLMERLPPEAEVKPAAVEYELAILKIISVGWSISYHMEKNPDKEPLLTLFWGAVQEFSKNLSETTELMIGQEIDYFQVLRERLDRYVAAMEQRDEAEGPAPVVGVKFAAQCGNKNDIFAFMTGSKLFMSVVARVRQYLQAALLEPTEPASGHA